MTDKDNGSRTAFLPRQAWLVAVNFGLLLIVAGTALPLLHVTGPAFRYIYSAGALAVLVGRLFAPSTAGMPLRARRLCRLEIWAGIIFCVGAFFMFYTPYRMDWIAFTLAGAVVQIYASMTIPRALSKATEEETPSKKRKK